VPLVEGSPAETSCVEGRASLPLGEASAVRHLPKLCREDEWVTLVSHQNVGVREWTKRHAMVHVVAGYEAWSGAEPNSATPMPSILWDAHTVDSDVSVPRPAY
jgi:hypothetical protein